MLSSFIQFQYLLKMNNMLQKWTTLLHKVGQNIKIFIFSLLLIKTCVCHLLMKNFFKNIVSWHMIDILHIYYKLYPVRIALKEMKLQAGECSGFSRIANSFYCCSTPIYHRVMLYNYTLPWWMEYWTEKIQFETAISKISAFLQTYRY